MKHICLLPIAILVIASLACSLSGIAGIAAPAEATTAATERPPLVLPTSTIQQVPTMAPVETQEESLPTPTEAPTRAPAPAEPQGPVYFQEEFDDSISWTFKYMYGNNQEQCGEPALVEGQLRWSCKAGEETQIRLFEDEHIYEDVAVQVEIENHGSNTNWTALLCRVNEDGWLEFRFTTAGLYEVYRFDNARYEQGVNPYVYIADGATQLLTPGKTNNVVAMVCQGEEFTFYANGAQIPVKIPPKMLEEFARQASGGVGLGFQVMRDNPGPVDVGVEWFETFEP